MTDKGKAIAEIQQWLRNIQKNESDEPAIIPDGIYSAETRADVENFQRRQSLDVTGIVDFLTWESLKKQNGIITAQREPPRQVAPISNEDLPLEKGMDNIFTDMLKLMLNRVAQSYVNFEFIDEEGFGEQTRRQLEKWQEIAFVERTGKADKETWNSLASFYLLK